jgi:hypothetical protein
MNALLYAVNEIKNNIPAQVLQAGMMADETPETLELESIDHKLMRKVIKGRVLLDANIVGGIEMIIPIDDMELVKGEIYYSIYRVSPELTNEKEIVSVLSVIKQPGSLYGTNVSTALYQNTTGIYTNSASARMGSSYGSAGLVNNAHVELVAYNTILIYAHFGSLFRFAVRCVVENNSNLSNISPRSYKKFAQLCILATKAYIYNKLIVHINSGYLQSGQELGVFKDIIESYADAHEQYHEYLHEVWSKVAFLNDTQRTYNYIGSLINPSI